MMSLTKSILFFALLLGLTGCASYPPMKTVYKVDLKRFMVDWYVVANIPTFIEVDAHNAVESYELNSDGTVATTFTFRDGSYNGDKKTYNPTGYIIDNKSNALWGMQFIWPIKADYRIIYLDKDYAGQGKNEKYLLGIIRNSRDSDSSPNPHSNNWLAGAI